MPVTMPDRAFCAAKRAIDVVGASVALTLAAPLMLGVAGLIGWQLGRPVLFRQRRAGKHGAPFTIYKFRTMRDARAPDGTILPDAERLSGLGRFLRASSIDELPELFNVLAGTMSLVGPRPLLEEYVQRYSPDQARRLSVQPGITGWAQVNGRNALTWDEKFAHDIWYVDRQSIWLDLRILAKTVAIVLTGSGISHSGDATMPVFMGTSQTAGSSQSSSSTSLNTDVGRSSGV